MAARGVMNCLKGLLISILLLSNAGAIFAGNRVIVKKFDWRIYSTEHFDIYYYKDSKGWLKYAASSLERAYRKISLDLNPSLDKRLPFFFTRAVMICNRRVLRISPMELAALRSL